MKFLPLLLFIVLCTSCLHESIKNSQPSVYCVTSSDDPGNSTCHSLKYYMTNSSQFFKSNTTFIFHNGIHLTDFNSSLQVSNVSGLTLEGRDAVIQCKQKGNTFGFHDIQNLVIKGLNFSQCGYPSTNESFGCSTLRLSSIMGLELVNVVISKSEYQGMLMDNATGQINISDSTIEVCQTNKSNKSDKEPANVIYFSLCNNSTLNVINSRFFRNTNSIVREPNTALDYPFAAGLTVVIRCPNIAVYFDNVTAIGNSGGDGGNLAFIFHTPGLDQVPPVVVNNSHIKNGVAVDGGGIFASLVEPVLPSNMPERKRYRKS